MLATFNKKDIRTTRNRVDILGSKIDPHTWESAIYTIQDWVEKHESRYICICNVHSVVTAKGDSVLRQVINDADMATPDGMPIAWYMRKLGYRRQLRINGPDLMLKYCEQAARQGRSVFLFGSTSGTLELLRTNLIAAFPNLNIAGAYSPPFRSLTVQEDREITDRINASDAGVVFVSLGCPKQEKWMAAHRGKIHAVMIGVGAAFDYHAGTIKRAPRWMQNNGLEWLYRLLSEPRRLWRRYLITNMLFILGIGKQIVLKRNDYF